MKCVFTLTGLLNMDNLTSSQVDDPTSLEPVLDLGMTEAADERKTSAWVPTDGSPRVDDSSNLEKPTEDFDEIEDGDDSLLPASPDSLHLPEAWSPATCDYDMGDVGIPLIQTPLKQPVNIEASIKDVVLGSVNVGPGNYCNLLSRPHSFRHHNTL